MRFFREYHEQGRFVKRLNAMFLVLVAKKGGAKNLKDFRPISLVVSLYKLLAKVLVNRLKRMVNKVVSNFQNAFVGGSQILDAMLIANEAIDLILKSKRSRVLYKLDVEKTYDHVNWDFLLEVLEKMGFSQRWISCISWCISCPRFSVNVNGAPSGF